MTESVRFPVIITEGTEVSVFPTLEEARGYLEATAAHGRLCAAFDSEGRSIELEIAPPAPGVDPAAPASVRIGPAEKAPTHADDLRRLLSDYLQACGERIKPGTGLPDLIRRVRSLHLYRE